MANESPTAMNNLIVVEREKMKVVEMFPIPRFYSDEQKLAMISAEAHLSAGCSGQRYVACIYEPEESSNRLVVKARWLYDSGGWDSAIGKANVMLILRAKGVVVSLKRKSRAFARDNDEVIYEMVVREGPEEVAVEVSKYEYERYVEMAKNLGLAEDIPVAPPPPFVKE